MRAVLAACAILALGSAAAAAEPARAPDQRERKAAAAVPPGVVDGATARRLVAAGVKVVDVRTSAEFAAGHVPGAVNIPHDEMDRRYAELGPSSTPLLVYCRSGQRSGIAIEILRRHGFRQIYDMKSYDAWVRSAPSQPKK